MAHYQYLMGNVHLGWLQEKFEVEDKLSMIVVITATYISGCSEETKSNDETEGAESSELSEDPKITGGTVL